MLNQGERDHFRRLRSTTFTPRGGERAPRWLAQQVLQCTERYAGIRLTPQFEAMLQQFRSHEEEPFEVFVVGEGNFGKSTLVNALLGQKMSTVDYRPETRSFLRYILKSKPAQTARLFLRLEPQMHNWLDGQLPTGKRCDIYNALEYELSLDQAETVLKEDVERCRAAERHNAEEEKELRRAQERHEKYTPKFDRYTPAVLELERELQWCSGSLFSEGVRLVDTQGLNQIFGDDLLRDAANEPLMTSEERFERWMRTSPRGKHVHFQFRRCDGVLWLVHASRLQSGASLAAMNYLRKYGKATVLAVTNIDKFNAVEARAILAKASERYQDYVSCIVPVNGKLAMQSSLSHDEPGIQNSGLAELVEKLRQACLIDSASVRAVGQYAALRTTEDQLLCATSTAIREINEVKARLTNFRSEIPKCVAKTLSATKGKLQQASSTQLQAILDKIWHVTLDHDDDEIREKLGTTAAFSNFRNMVQATCMVANGEIESLAKDICSQEYSLPAFDADGNAHGSSVTARDVAKPLAITTEQLLLQFSFSLGFWNSIWHGLGFMRASTSQRLTQEKRASIKSEVRSQWDLFASKTLDELEKQLSDICSHMEASLLQIERDLEGLQGESLTDTRQRLVQLQGDRCVTSCFVTAVVLALRARLVHRTATAHA